MAMALSGWNNPWKLTALGLGLVGVTALVTGLVVANRVGVRDSRVEAPASLPRDVIETTPPRSVIAACNQYAAAQTGPQRDKKGKIVEAAKDGAIGGAAIGAIADGGSGAGKGAAIGGLVGAGAGTLYGIYDNKKHDERYRTAYSSCMRQRGYVG
jgi:hypothetical protein